MYQPPLFREDRIEVMHDLMRAHPLAMVVSYGESGIAANHLPLVLSADDSPRGTLRGHVAKPNPFWTDYDPAVEVLAVFQGPQHYISPGWYPSKKEHGKVVPTWNYAVVHAYGPMRVFDDTDWVIEHLRALTAQQEGGRDQPWAVTDAPSDFVARQLKGIVGFEIPISRIEGKWKMSQNRAQDDRQGVVKGLHDEGTSPARQVADLIPP